MADSAFPVVATTDEVAWLDWATRLPELEVRAARALVVAPHPDDETLGCGGLVADLCRRGVDVVVVAVTDGERSHPDHTPLRVLRRAEQDRALPRLGVSQPARRLVLPDGDVDAARAALRRRLGNIVNDGVDVVVAPWKLDGHCDHDACGAVAEEIAAASGCRLLAYPVWAWQWARPHDLDGFRWRRHSMSRLAHDSKLAAIDAYRTQTTDIVGEVIVGADMLVRFRRPFEVFADVG